MRRLPHLRSRNRQKRPSLHSRLGPQPLKQLQVRLHPRPLLLLLVVSHLALRKQHRHLPHPLPTHPNRLSISVPLPLQCPHLLHRRRPLSTLVVHQLPSLLILLLQTVSAALGRTSPPNRQSPRTPHRVHSAGSARPSLLKRPSRQLAVSALAHLHQPLQLHRPGLDLPLDKARRPLPPTRSAGLVRTLRRPPRLPQLRPRRFRLDLPRQVNRVATGPPQRLLLELPTPLNLPRMLRLVSVLPLPLRLDSTLARLLPPLQPCNLPNLRRIHSSLALATTTHQIPRPMRSERLHRMEGSVHQLPMDSVLHSLKARLLKHLEVDSTLELAILRPPTMLPRLSNSALAIRTPIPHPPHRPALDSTLGRLRLLALLSLSNLAPRNLLHLLLPDLHRSNLALALVRLLPPRNSLLYGLGALLRVALMVVSIWVLRLLVRVEGRSSRYEGRKSRSWTGLARSDRSGGWCVVRRNGDAV